MGNVQSSTIKQMVKDVTTAVNSYVNNSTSTAGMYCDSIQNITVNCGTSDVCGPSPPTPPCVLSDFSAKNASGTICQLSSSDSTSMTANMTTSVQNAIQQTATQNQAEVAGWVQASVNAQSADIHTTTDLINHINNLLEQSTLSSCVNSVVNNQGLVLNVCGTATDVQFQNTSTQNAIANCVMNQVMGVLQSDDVVNQVAQIAEEKQVLKVTSIVATVCAVVFLLIVLMVAYGYYKKRQRQIASRPAAAPRPKILPPKPLPTPPSSS